ncbi:hypothetical protein FWG95_01265 [Candidatus Saccharibacteria bacterium]|nr:hypothetical protein [Candidatus Saccharibacteria bacterium]
MGHGIKDLFKGPEEGKDSLTYSVENIINVDIFIRADGSVTKETRACYGQTGRSLCVEIKLLRPSDGGDIKEIINVYDEGGTPINGSPDADAAEKEARNIWRRDMNQCIINVAATMCVSAVRLQL